MLTKRAAAAIGLFALLFGLGLITLFPVPAQAEMGSWSYAPGQGEGTSAMHGAWIADTKGFELAVDCAAYAKDHSIYLITDQPWDETAEYPDPRQLTFTINGTDHSHDFENEASSDAGLLTFAVYETHNAEEVTGLIAALREAKGTITVSYGTNRVDFPAEGISGALAQLDAACGSESNLPTP